MFLFFQEIAKLAVLLQNKEDAESDATSNTKGNFGLKMFRAFVIQVVFDTETCGDPVG